MRAADDAEARVERLGVHPTLIHAWKEQLVSQRMESTSVPYKEISSANVAESPG